MITLDLGNEIIQCTSQEFLAVLRDVVLKRSSIQEVSEKIFVGRESLYKSLSENGNPNFFTVLKIIQFLGIKIIIEKKQNGTRKRNLRRI